HKLSSSGKTPRGYGHGGFEVTGPIVGPSPLRGRLAQVAEEEASSHQAARSPRCSSAGINDDRISTVRPVAPNCLATNALARLPKSRANSGSLRARTTKSSSSSSLLTTTAPSATSSACTMSRKFHVLGPNEVATP